MPQKYKKYSLDEDSRVYTTEHPEYTSRKKCFAIAVFNERFDMLSYFPLQFSNRESAQKLLDAFAILANLQEY